MLKNIRIITIFLSKLPAVHVVVEQVIQQQAVQQVF